MERRHITFILLAASLLLTFNLLNTLRQPEAPPVPEDQEVAEVDRPSDPQKPSAEDAAPAEDDEEKIEHPRQFATLGSVDPNDGYRMLVTLDSWGASVYRVELSNPRYQSYEHDDDGGYLGQLVYEDLKEGGVRINVVGPGTPAANAISKTANVENGLRAGDILLSVQGEAVSNGQEVQKALQATDAGDEVELVVRRQAAQEGEAPQEATFVATLRKHPVEVIKPNSMLLPNANGGEPDVVEHPPAFLTTLAQVGSLTARPGEEIRGLPSLMKANWKVTQVSPNEVHFETTLTSGDLAAAGENRKLRLVKKFRLGQVTEETSANSGFHIDYDLEIHNEAEEPLNVAYRQLGPTGLPLEGWWYAHKITRGWGTAGVRDVTWESEDGSQFTMFTVYELVDQAEKEGAEPRKPLYNQELNPGTKYAGVDAQYFNCSLLLNEEQSSPGIELAGGSAFPIGPIDPDFAPRTDCTFSLESRAYPIGAGENITQSFQIFAGPKLSDVLTEYGLSEVEYYGWFSPVSWFLLQILHFLYSILGNYGLAIIVLTLIVRGAMHPISRKQAKNMQIQQELAPEIKRISDQYKDKPEERLRAQQELFKKHNFNPLGGCLMMFLQLPIFLGLYRGLAVDFELRQAPLIPGISWCSNLAAPDQFWYWGNIMPEFITRPTGFLSLGPYLNILPLVTVVLFLVQQKLFMPPPQDEQQAMQQRIMTFMMLFMGIIFFKVPSGLCVYFITSSIWGIIERKMLPKPKNLPQPTVVKKEETRPTRVRPAKKKK